MTRMSATVQRINGTHRNPAGQAQKITAAFRWPDDVVKEIKQRAKRHDLSMTDYVRMAALGELSDRSTVDERFERLEERIDQLERALSLGGYG